MEKQHRVIALGFFDGVHLGHGALLRAVKETADRLGAVPAALTFDESPAAVITGRTVPLLTTVQERADLMERLYGIQEVVVAPFQTMQHMDWEDFITEYLVNGLGVVHVVAGHDFRFGYQGRGNPDRLRAKCEALGVGCEVIQAVEREGVTISSTYIRTLIAQGEMERADRFLGHPFHITGAVNHGKHLGSVLGCPTINLSLPAEVIAPAFGVYATKVWVLPADPQHLTGEGPYTAVTNVGVRPTVADGDRMTVECFLLDFSGDLYGRTVRVEFYKYLRPERKFPSIEALAEEIQHNARQTREFFAVQGL